MLLGRNIDIIEQTVYPLQFNHPDSGVKNFISQDNRTTACSLRTLVQPFERSRSLVVEITEACLAVAAPLETPRS